MVIRDWKHRVREALNRAGVDILPLTRSPVMALRGLRRYGIRTVIDIGANEGQFARRARRLFPKARVVCFEPLRKPFARLEAWSRRSKGSVVAHRIALGDREGEVLMHRHLDHDPSSSMLRTTNLAVDLFPRLERQAAATVGQTTLDAAVRVIVPKIEPEILVKMDVQGYEDRVIRGGRATLGRARACLLEVGLVPLYEEQASFHDLVRTLSELRLLYAGTAHQVHDRQGRAIYGDVLFVRPGS